MLVDVKNASYATILSAARTAEQEERWSDCFRLCQELLRVSPHDANAFNLLGRLALVEGNLARAVGFQRMALRHVPGHTEAVRDLAFAHSLIPSAEEAARLFERALSCEPDIDYHHRSLGSTEPFAGMPRVEAIVRAALLLDPSFARAHAALGNIQSRRGDRTGAMASYALALMLDFAFAGAHIALAHYYDSDDKDALAAEHFREAFSRQLLYRTYAPYALRRVLLLKAAGAYPANAHLEWCIDQRHSQIDVFYVTADSPALPDLDGYDAVFSAMGETETYAATVNRCISLLASERKPVINHPAGLKTVRRSELPSTLRGIPGCITLPAHRVAAGEVPETLELPFLIRPVDTHRGDSLALVHTPADVQAYLAGSKAKHFNITPFADYKRPDGYYRKYRVIVVAGKPFAYHLAISDHWLVHYWRVTGLMRENAWMRAEEEHFLRDAASVFPNWEPLFRHMSEAIGLEYFGVDCTLLPSGEVLVFECDPCAFVHCREADDAFGYKFEYVPRIFAAVDEMLSAYGERAGRILV
jgi:tetratricopeptide (TPR) repeat protein